MVRLWSAEQEKQLRDLVDAGMPLEVIAKALGRSVEAVRMKVHRLGLCVVEKGRSVCSTTTAEFVRPVELSSVEEILKDIHAAVAGLKTPGLDRTEVLRLRGIILGCKEYKAMLVEYMDYRGLEAELLEWRRRFGEFEKKS